LFPEAAIIHRHFIGSRSQLRQEGPRDVRERVAEAIDAKDLAHDPILQDLRLRQGQHDVVGDPRAEAIDLEGYTDAQVRAMIDALAREAG